MSAERTRPPQAVLDLIERFERNRESYKSPQYNETQLRREFLDPFFKALGWDIDNEQGYAEPYKDVVHEYSMRMGERTKAPDYCFRIGGAEKFLVEAKRPSIDIKNNIEPAFQLRRYAWTKKLPLSILTDFEEFAVYDCRVKPDQKHKAGVARILYIPFTEYVERWDEITSVFSRDAVLKGGFDKYAESNRLKRGTADVDEEFLKTIENWRADLARNLALRNPKLTQRELNFAVQRIIDRIIFLRICEGRGIESYGRLQALANGDRIYPRLCQLFEEADARYNSGLFHFKPEKGRHETPDELTLGLALDDKLLRDIFHSLYYPQSPYVFSALPADILGQVYEQFLGKVIRLTESHHAVVEEKPEVKKAGGVYYTPTYIVNYIVESTVGKLLQGKAPKQASKLKILDPACGSGSFLLGAYEYLLKWHLNYYTTNDPKKWAKGAKPTLVQIVHDYDGARTPIQGWLGESKPKIENWRLTISERKRILLDNIFGVDIDSQAVETTKLSLLLKVLEGETQQSLQPVLSIFHERALPDLGDNIKCGNSLIGSDFYQQQQLALLTEDERYCINVFDWDGKDGFPEIMVSGGFDAVIGNPPYVRIQGFPEEQIDYFAQKYKSARGNFDLYIPFLERGFRLLGANGLLGMITPNKFFRTDYGEALRSLLSSERAVRRVVDFGANQVFAATTYTCLLFLRKPESDTFELGAAKADQRSLASVEFQMRHSSSLGEKAWTFASELVGKILAKLESNSIRLLDLPADMSRGSSTGDDETFVVGKNEARLESGILRTPLFASDFGRYKFEASSKWQVIFPYEKSSGKYRLLVEDELQGKFPKTFSYLSRKQPALKRRKQFAKWFGYSAARNLELHDEAQIAVPLLADRGLFSLIPTAMRGKLCAMASGGFTITLHKSKMRPEYVLGLLNSKLLFWRLQGMSNVFRGGWITCTKQYFGELPIRRIDFALVNERSQHDEIVSLVEHIIDLEKRHSASRTPQERTSTERQISATNAQIDKLVYELYDLTPEEIAIVEGKSTTVAQSPDAANLAPETAPEGDKELSYAEPPPAPTHPSLTPEQAAGDAAHYYSAKEEPPPYGEKGLLSVPDDPKSKS